jgi:REP element-mobilizing transposase RayT
MQEFLNPYDVIQIHGASLPHWQQGTAFVFVTWRLADSLPTQKLREWKNERAVWLAKHPLPWDVATWESYNERFPEKIEAWLDQGLGACLLRHESNREVVYKALAHFDSQRYTLQAYVVMPNHVHLLCQLREGVLLEDVLHSWKSYTSKQIQELTGSAGQLWQEGYWDRLMRSREHYHRSIRYIRENPIKAGLAEWEYSYWERGEGGVGAS